MSKMIYFYGVMKASKTAQLLTMKYNYHKNGISPIVLKPKIDGKGNMVTSRIGLKTRANIIVDTQVSNQREEANRVYQKFIHGDSFTDHDTVILIDEAQFLTPEFIDTFSTNCKLADIDIYSFGLLKDYKGKLFLGAKAWLEHADSIREIKTTCELCNHKATCNALEDKDGNLVPDTFNSKSTVLHTGDDEYHVYCQYHMLTRIINYKEKNKGRIL